MHFALPPLTALILAALLPASPALAADPAPGNAGVAEPDPEADEPAPPVIPPATDLLAWHPLLGVAGKFALPFGELDTERSLGRRTGTGYGVAGDLGLGVSRSIELGVWADYVVYGGDRDDCPDCETKSLGVGPFIRYHLVQGMRFDPFLFLGAGHRSVTITGDGPKTTDSGLAWLKFALGGTWYALAQVGFGPYVELELATLTDTPEGADPSVFASFGTGLRLQFDVRGR
jgi:hypothetical protein